MKYEKNADGNVVLYTSNSLKFIMKKKNLVITTGRLTLRRMIDMLSGMDVENVQMQQERSVYANNESVVLNHKADAAARAIVERSFLPHQKSPQI
jgi:hypothetical protein